MVPVLGQFAVKKNSRSTSTSPLRQQLCLGAVRCFVPNSEVSYAAAEAAKCRAPSCSTSAQLQILGSALALLESRVSPATVPATSAACLSAGAGIGGRQIHHLYEGRAGGHGSRLPGAGLGWVRTAGTGNRSLRRQLVRLLQHGLARLRTSTPHPGNTASSFASFFPA